MPTPENQTYNPCRNGIHVCGISSDEEEFVTIANVPGVDERQFDILETHFALPPEEDPDLVVDLMADGDIVRDFGIRRQQLVAIIKSAEPNHGVFGEVIGSHVATRVAVMRSGIV